jgi:predicted amidohydrolase
MNNFRVGLAVQKSIPGAFEKNLAATLEAVTIAAGQNAQMIVFPEMNLSGYMADPKHLSIVQPLSSKLTKRLSAAADKFNIIILVGLAEQTENKLIFVSHLVFSPHSPMEKYRKIHLAPNEKEYFSQGNKVTTFRHSCLHFGIQLCYDAHFPELSTAMAAKGVDIIFIPHASPRGNAQEKYLSWMRHLTARAFDNGIFIAALNQTGDNTLGLNFPGLALLIGPDGKIVSRFLDSEEKIHCVDVDLTALERVRSHRMRYFLPNRRSDLFG